MGHDFGIGSYTINRVSMLLKGSKMHLHENSSILGICNFTELGPFVRDGCRLSGARWAEGAFTWTESLANVLVTDDGCIASTDVKLFVTIPFMQICLWRYIPS